MEVVSDLQEKLGSLSAGKMHRQASLEAKFFDGSAIQTSTCSDEHVFKVRKPYTITKNRERWTEEEHNKFLEALKLYGRAWRRIEEHIGTKTAVQIRSHAQKFFSKVTRDSTVNSANGTAIEIPPARPKKKPMHPYPRKMGSLSTKGTSDMPQHESSSSQVVCAQENGSPTSVLSGIGSCTSPTSAGGSTPAGMSPNHKEKYQSYSPLDDEATRLLLQLPTSMDGDSGAEIVTHCNEDQLVEVEASPPTIKLFGRTVLVTDSRKPISLPVDDANCNQSAPVANVGQDEAAKRDGKVADQGIDSSGASQDSVWNPWIGSVPPILFYMPMGGNQPAEAPTVPVPWWSLCGGAPLPLFHQQNPTLTQSAAQSCIEAGNRQPKEGSWTGSNMGSVSEIGPVNRSSDTGEIRSTASSLKLGEKADRDGPHRGFVPYKRSLTERESQQSEVVTEGGGSQRIRLSL